ncbi:AAA family ATPase [Pseudomonas sp. Z8(2022)]|uniref:AAA family ATPase n=1 Tax=Pseudomonas sp. Z8(2022) TaxID=2962597 RepID=UPI0021F4EC71|nr:AAA family ATPase [Pseudomonas sp. Z8(2022)]UYP32239.1 AAA family ATPase [Pseudomonas sp. Z8(2022)]
MKLKKLTIRNFRQFYGEVSISFSTDDQASVTVIHGENGAGKTSLLNAFKWVLYGATDFDTNNENILSEKAIAEAAQDSTIVMSVTLEFDDDGATYTAHREQKFAKGAGLHVESLGPSVPSLTLIDSAGLSRRSSNPGSQLNQILPEDMHSYFFFNGERIEKLAYNSASTQVREAIKALMGLNILDRAEKQLKNSVVRHFNKEAKDSSSGNMTALLDEQSRLTDKIQKKEEEISGWKKTLSEIDLEIEAIDKRLHSIEAIAEKQKRREELENQLEQIKKDKDDASSALNKNVTERGFLAFIDTELTEVKQYLDEMRIRGEMPSKVKATFIDDLIELGKCICGQPLEPGSECVSTLESYKTTIKDNGVEEQFMTLFGDMSHLQTARKALFANINELMNRLADLGNRRQDLLGKIDELGEEIKGVEDSAKLETRRMELKARSKQLYDNCLLGEHQKSAWEDQLKDKDKEIEKELANTNQADLSQRRKQLAKEVADTIGELHEAMAHKVRSDLSKKVDDTFRKIMRKDYWAEIDDDFTLKIFKNIEGHGKQPVLEKSTGENQITSLCFISSIVNTAKEWASKPSVFQKGGIYPIVMDSPFGALDPEYRQKVATFIPALADQVIVMVSKSQWRGEVESELSKRLGKQYTLKYHKPDPSSDEKFEYTKLEEGFYG